MPFANNEYDSVIVMTTAWHERVDLCVAFALLPLPFLHLG
jgi:hypothetical protein